MIEKGDLLWFLKQVVVGTERRSCRLILTRVMMIEKGDLLWFFKAGGGRNREKKLSINSYQGHDDRERRLALVSEASGGRYREKKL